MESIALLLAAPQNLIGLADLVCCFDRVSISRQSRR